MTHKGDNIASSQADVQRNSAIELLRIISMFMIVFHHFARHGGFEWGIPEMTIPHFWYNFIVMGGRIAVNVFVLISGWCLINSKFSVFNLRKCLKFWGQLVFYSISISLLFRIFSENANHLGLKECLKMVFPITYSTWWFASTYFVMYLLHPFLNIFLQSLKKKQYQLLLIMLIICWSIIPTFTTSQYQSNSLLWFIALYAIAGYARKYGFNPKFKTHHYFIIWIISSVLTYFTSVVFAILGTKWSVFASHSTYFYGQNRISALLISISLFMVFATLKMNYSKWINRIASATFGVYLIHEHTIIRKLLWIDLFKIAQYQKSLILIPYSILVVITVFVVCICIDLMRQSIFERIFICILNKLHVDEWSKSIGRIVNRCENVIWGNGNEQC